MAKINCHNVRMKHYSKEIDINVLKETFSSIQHSNNFAMDIGGSLIKIVYQTNRPYKRKVPICQDVSFDYIDKDAVQSCLCFMKFETRQLEECLNFILENIVSPEFVALDRQINLKITGGGALKYKDLLSKKLNVIIEKEDEMESLIRGSLFFLKNIPDEVFYFEELVQNDVPNFSSSCLINPFPFLLVNIGSGVSILRVNSEQDFVRVGGTSIGGGTFWGIGSVLLPGKSFDELLAMASCGDYENVDMLVKHVYGGAYETLSLTEDLIACSFGQAAKGRELFSKEDLMNSLLVSITNNIAQISCLHADICNVKRIIFGGFFTRGHLLTMKLISSSVQFCSKRTINALFLRHEGYLGAVGAFLKSMKTNIVETPQKIEVHNILNSTWLENYAGSALFGTMKDDQPMKSVTGLLRCDTKCSKDFTPTKYRLWYGLSKSHEDLSVSAKSLLSFETHELERIDDRLEVFRLLFSPQTYTPDSWDLTSDKEARIYWLNCFKTNIHFDIVYQSQKEHSETAKIRSEQYFESYKKYLTDLEDDPALHGVLTVRCILDANQNFLRKFGFTDPYWMQKKKENEFALKIFSQRINLLKSLNWNARQYQLVIGLLAGNVFDWGSKAVVSLMENAKDGVIDFSEAVNKLQPKPWLIDGYEKWVEKLSSKSSNEPVYQSVLIFCDNSGFDFLIGVVPFAIEFLSRGSTVILSANTEPAINDVTFSEIVILLKTLAQITPELDVALKNEKLILVPSGQLSPCLDLRFVSRRLNQITDSSKVDLVVIEGMARAIHTNLMAEFSCDSLKVAVIKNAWLAKRLGGQLFSVVFKYEQFTAKERLLTC